MGLHFIGGKRESLTFSGEAHKKSIRNYLESLGYSQTTDSFVEGHLPDMIFYNRDVSPGKEFWIESKATNASISGGKFAKEVLHYLISWLKMPPEKRFVLWIFAQQVSRIGRWESLFEKNDRESIDDWINTNISQLPEKEKEFLISADKFDIYAFFNTTIVTVALSAKLDIAAEEKKKTSISSLERKADLLLRESERRNHLIEEKCLLITNLLNFSYPKTIVKQKTECQSIDELYQKLTESQLPPFMLNGGYLYSFCDAECLVPFDEIVIGSPIKLNSQDFLESNEYEFVKLMNFHLEKYARSRGLRKYLFNTYFFSLKPNQNGDFRERKKMSYTKQEIFVSKPMFYKNENKTLNYVFHRAVHLRTKILWNHPYIVILPVRHFTSDGKTAIQGSNKDRLDRKFRNPMYNRSDFYLRMTRFWKYYLFEQKFENSLFDKWFKNFNFGNLESFTLFGIPQSLDKKQTLLFSSDGGD
jgi:hypothetical protein